jgi:hypothetical protein
MELFLGTRKDEKKGKKLEFGRVPKNSGYLGLDVKSKEQRVINNEKETKHERR